MLVRSYDPTLMSTGMPDQTKGRPFPHTGERQVLTSVHVDEKDMKPYKMRKVANYVGHLLTNLYGFRVPLISDQAVVNHLSYPIYFPL